MLTILSQIIIIMTEGNFLKVMDIFIALIVVISQVYACVKPITLYALNVRNFYVYINYILKLKISINRESK